MTIEKLINGFRAFRSSYFEKTNHYEELVRNGQSPETLVIACSDSRNDPALLTQSKPGDIFVVRNVAAIVPPYEPDMHHHGTSSAIEFAVKGLKVKNIVVLGHAMCGGIKALSELGSEEASQFEFLSRWIEIGAEAKKNIDTTMKEAPPAARQRALERAMVSSSLKNLMSFPWIKSAVEAGTVQLYGWYFDMINGKLLGMDLNNPEFREIGHDEMDKLAENMADNLESLTGDHPHEPWPDAHIRKRV
jgi:carbonic anhydrase